MQNLKNKNILLTGGSRGIGAAIVKKLVACGANVAFTYFSSSTKADALINELKTDNTKLKAYQSDASDFEAAEKLIESVLADFSTIDVLLNNAGITRDGLLMRMSEANWDDVMTNNLKSVFNLSKCVIKPMMKQRNGAIINMSSIVGMRGNAGQTNYAASKAGIIGFTKSLAQELGSRNIRCNAIAPGFIATEMTEELDEKVKDNYISNIPLKRFGTGEDVANLTAFLASDQAAYISGQVISICGALNC